MKKITHITGNKGVFQTAPDPLPRRLIRAGLVALGFLVPGIVIGLGFFSKPITPPQSLREARIVEGDGSPEFAPAILGALVTEQRPDGQEWQSMVLTGQFNGDLDGTVHMSLYQEPADVLRARFEAEARKGGWRDLEGWANPTGKMEFYHGDGRVRIISIEEYPNDLRSVTIFDGRMARRKTG